MYAALRVASQVDYRLVNQSINQSIDLFICACT